MEPEGEEKKGIEALKNFERALGHVRNSVQPLTLMSRDEVGVCISPADRAKLNLQVAYGMSSLFYMFLRTQGVSPATHPVKTELDRMRGYFNRLKQVGKPPERPTLRVDAAASRRFIDNALSGDQTWQTARTTGSKEAIRRRGEAGIGRSLPAGQPELPTAPASARRIQDSSYAATTPGKRKHQTPTASSSNGRISKMTVSSVGTKNVRARAKAGADGAEPEGVKALAAAMAEDCPRVMKRAKSCWKGGNKGGERYHVS